MSESPRPAVGPRRASRVAPATTDDKKEIIDPVRFAEETLGVSLWDKQKEVLNAIRRRRRVAVKSGNGLGKDFTAAVALLWYLHAHDPGIVLSTAPTFRQVRHVLWRQIHALHRQATRPLGGQLLDTRWDLAKDRYALGLSATGADQFQGFHCENILVVVDEAEGVAEPIYEAIDAVMTSENVKLLLIGNPTRLSGAFYRAFHQERGIYEPITMSALDSPNVQNMGIDVPGLVTAQWVAERRAVWEENSDRFRSRVLGKFPERGEDSLIAMSDIEEAVYEGHPSPQQTAGGYDWSELFLPGKGTASGSAAIGVDVARFGSDRSVVAVRRGEVVEEISVFAQLDTMAVAGSVVASVRKHRPRLVNVDEVGIGSGVVDRLREQGIPVRGVNGAAAPWRDDDCANLRAEGYRALAERFRSRRIRIPDDPELIAELAALRYRYNSRGNLIIEGKDEIRSRGLPSPDKADALMLAFLDDRGDGFTGMNRINGMERI